MTRLLAILLLFCCIVLVAQARDYIALSTSAADVQAAVSACANGDRAIVPSGSATWSTTVANGNDGTHTNVILVGGGGTNGVTTITQGGSAMLFEFFGTFTIKNFTWVPTQYQVLWGKTHCESNNFFRVCSNIVLDASGSAGIATYNSGEGGGLIDNNYFAFTTEDVWTVIGNGDGPDIYAPGYSVPVGNYAYTITYGTTNYLYIEHNIVTSSDTGGSRPDGPLDAYGGAKFVMRYNSFTNCGMGGWHGTDSGSYISTYGYEVYGNFMWYTNIGNHWDVAWDSRGGTGMIFSNTIAGQASSLPNNLGGFKMWNVRADGSCSGNCSFWGGSTGNGYDGTGGSPYTGYPSMGCQGYTGPIGGYVLTGSGSSSNDGSFSHLYLGEYFCRWADAD